MKTSRHLFGIVLMLFMVIAPQESNAHRGPHGRHVVYTPKWIPAHMARANVRYVFFPDHNVYFDRWNRAFVYQEGRRWVARTRPPVWFSGINFNQAYMVGLNLNAARPFVYNSRHLARYRRTKYRHYESAYYQKGRNHESRRRAVRNYRN